MSLHVQVLRRVVDIYPWTTTQGLVEVVKQVGRRLIRANPMEFLVANVVRRVRKCLEELQSARHLSQTASEARKRRTVLGAFCVWASARRRCGCLSARARDVVARAGDACKIAFFVQDPSRLLRGYTRSGCVCFDGQTECVQGELIGGACGGCGVVCTFVGLRGAFLFAALR